MSNDPYEHAVLAHFGLSGTQGAARMPSRSLSKALTDLVQALETPARLGPALDAALDILIHGTLNTDCPKGRGVEHSNLSDHLFGCWPTTTAWLARSAQRDIDDLTHFLVNAVPRSVYEVLTMVLAQGFERYFALDPDLHPADVLCLLRSYDSAEEFCSCVIAALVQQLGAITPKDDPTLLQFSTTYCDYAKDYWCTFDFSDTAPSPETFAKLEPFLGTDAAIDLIVRERIDVLSTPDRTEGICDESAEGRDREHAIERMRDRERRLLNDPLQHHGELVRLRARLSDCEGVIHAELQREDANVA